MKIRISTTTFSLIVVVILLAGILGCSPSATSPTASSQPAATLTATQTTTPGTTTPVTTIPSPAATTPQPTTKTVTDMAGNTVVVPVNAQRIAFYWANQYEIMMAAGVTDKIVAIHPNVKKFIWVTKYQPEVMNICAPFSGTDVNLEELLAVKPDLVFMMSHLTNIIDKCRSAGLTVVVTARPTSLESIRQAALFIGEVLGGDANTRIKAWNTYVGNKLDMINTRLSSLAASERPTVANIITDKSLQVSGNNTIMEEWTRIAGGINVATEFTGYKDVDAEQFNLWDPDIIIAPSVKTKDILMTDGRFQELSAVKNGKVYVNPHGFFDWQYTAPTLALQLQWAAQILHPELFKDIDIRQETKYYHQTFMGYTLTNKEIEEIIIPDVYGAT
jgi:iron complex transport system substrate-binding protein